MPPQGPGLPLGGRRLLFSSLGLVWVRLWLRLLGVCPSPGHPFRHPAFSPGSQSGAPDSPRDPGLVPRLGERGRISALPQQLASRERGWLYFKLLSGSAGTRRPPLPGGAVLPSCPTWAPKACGHCPPGTQELLIHLQPRRRPYACPQPCYSSPFWHILHVPLPYPTSLLGGVWHSEW